MSKEWIFIYWLISRAYMCISYQSEGRIFYNGAVVKYSPVYLKSSVLTLRANSLLYVEYIAAAKTSKVDIIVFPEYGLTTINLPERKYMQDWATIIPKKYNPCTETSITVSEALYRISCSARHNRIYVVINIAEKAHCTQSPCPDDKMFYYNSNVVFDRTGKIIARYRKVHLHSFEKQLSVTETPEIVTFDTDFGVRFGTFTCMDILFYDPAIKLTREHGIADFVYPTVWFSETPFLTATQIQAGWSYAENVNLLASGYNRPNGSNIDSGIFLGRNKRSLKAKLFPNMKDGMVILNIETKKATKFIPFTSDISITRDDYVDPYNYLTVLSSFHQPEKISLQNYIVEKKNQKLKNKRKPEDIFLYRENIQDFETYILGGNASKVICHNNFCCKFQVGFLEMARRIKYRLVVFNGTRPFADVESKIYVCGIIQCSSDSILSCGSVQKSKTRFGIIKIATTFPDFRDVAVMPSSLSADLLPFEGWTYEEHIQNNKMNVVVNLKGRRKNLITLGIYAKNLKADQAIN